MCAVVEARTYPKIPVTIPVATRAPYVTEVTPPSRGAIHACAPCPMALGIALKASAAAVRLAHGVLKALQGAQGYCAMYRAIRSVVVPRASAYRKRRIRGAQCTCPLTIANEPLIVGWTGYFTPRTNISFGTHTVEPNDRSGIRAAVR